MSYSKSNKSKNIEDFQYTDLTKTELPEFIILQLIAPKKHKTDTLTNTTWLCECKSCGKTRNISGSVIVKKTYKSCPCFIPSTSSDPNERIVGKGIIDAMMNDKQKFSEYIEKREEERRKYSPGYIRQIN